MRWPKYWNFSFSIIPSKEIPGLIFRMGWLDLLVVQGTPKSLLQHHSSKVSILQHSAFFTVQLSHPYMTTGKTIALTMSFGFLRWKTRKMIFLLKTTKRIVVVQSLSRVQLLFVTPWATTHQASLSLTISLSLLKLDPLS